MRDAGFEAGTTVWVVWSATNEPPHLHEPLHILLHLYIPYSEFVFGDFKKYYTAEFTKIPFPAEENLMNYLLCTSDMWIPLRTASNSVTYDE